MLLWKYMDLEYGIKSILSGLFKVTAPLDLNDSTEMMGAVIGNLPDEVKSQMEDSFRHKWQMELDAGKPVRGWQEVKFDIDNKTKDIMKKIVMERNSINRTSRVLCLSSYDLLDDCGDQLLWAHYGDKGRGVRILVDIDQRPNDNYHLHPAIYASMRPVLDLSKFKYWLDQDEFAPYNKKCIYTKSVAWSYEKEIRLFTFLGPKNKRIIHEHDTGIDLFVIPVSNIKRVDFGPKGEIQEMLEMVHLLHSIPATRHIQTRVATFDNDGYGYRYNPVSCDDYKQFRR